MFVGKLRTLILMLSKGEVLLERAHLGSLLSIHRSEELDLVSWTSSCGQSFWRWSDDFLFLLLEVWGRRMQG